MTHVGMTGNLIIAAIILLIGGCALRLKARSTTLKQRRDGRLIALIAFMLGPLLAAIYWAIEVNLLDPSTYERHPEDAWALLPPVMAIGIFVGVVSAFGFLIILGLRTPSKHTQSE